MPALMINTLTQSTQAYLSLLDQNNAGTQAHQVSNIVQELDGLTLIDNQTWKVITCQLPRRQKIKTDSGASLVPNGQPGQAIGVQILAYDPATGHARLAVEEIPPDNEGQLIIDFKWLIRRVLHWLQAHGANVRNPFLLQGHPPSIAESFTSEQALIQEKHEAILTLLNHPAAYVWGPPGTGKTRHVLAEAVAYLFRQGKKILVAAPTNLAVDNALAAILQMPGVTKNKVLRVGIPTSDFRGKWPECCEERALEEQLAKLKKQHDLQVSLYKAGQRKMEISARLLSCEFDVKQYAAELKQAGRDVDQLSHELNLASAKFNEVSRKCAQTNTLISDSQYALTNLSLAVKKAELEALENEQSSLILEKQQIKTKLDSMGWWARKFTHQVAQLTQLCSTAEGRLKSVEATLAGQRTRFVELKHEGCALEEQIVGLVRQQADHLTEQKMLETEVENVRSKHSAATQRRDRAEERLQLATDELTNIHGELEQLDALGELPLNEDALALMAAEIDKLDRAMSKITQNLSEKLVLGMTLDGFIGLTMNQSLSFDHAIVDEAGYAPLAKVIPLCSLHCPISLLGDHCQLPPVYEGKNDPLSECYWGTSALYLEEAFAQGVGNVPTALLARAQAAPQFQQLQRSVLTQTFRFGPALADLLDRHFYENIGLTSQTDGTTTIELVDCPPYVQRAAENWQNYAEAEMIVDRVRRWLNWPAADKGTLAVLSPYTAQVRLIERMLNERYRNHPDCWLVEVLSVNRAQGLEWDTVFLSASDTGRLQGNGPFLADAANPKGKLVMNTAISRAKKHVRIFMDAEYWRQRVARPSLLTELAAVTT